MVPFAGWHMPIQYKDGVIQEHLSVRNDVGLFDVSHMGEIDVVGKGASDLVQRLITNDVSRMIDGSILYTLMCKDHGGALDDLLVYRFSENHYLFCVNASNSEKDFRWVKEQAKRFDVKTKNISAETAQLAIQGPSSEVVLESFFGSLDDLKYYHFTTGKMGSVECVISRTGYTGEDGFEIYCEFTEAPSLYMKIMKAGRDFHLKPVGLAARDTLRMEMGYVLYGQEIDESTSPLEAGLGWVIKMDTDDFLGKAALMKQKSSGLQRKLVGMRLLDRGVPRKGFSIFREDRKVGELTSGTHSPSLKSGIGLGYVEKEFSEIGTKLELEIRGQRVKAEIVRLPFIPSRVKK